MHATTIFTTAIMAAVAIAVPTSSFASHNIEGRTVGDVCGNGNTIKCCNDFSTGGERKGSGGLLGLLEQADMKCSDINIPVIAGADVIKQACKSQPVCCGEIKQSGLINVGCTPIEI